MKRSDGQFPTCDNCGREIRGASTKVLNKNGGTQEFHVDAHGCSSSPEPRSARAVDSKKMGQFHTPNYSIADATDIGYHGNNK